VVRPLDVPSLALVPPPKVMAMTGLAKSRIASWIGPHRKSHTRRKKKSTHKTVTREGMVELPSKISARLMLIPELVATGGTKVRNVKMVYITVSESEGTCIRMMRIASVSCIGRDLRTVVARSNGPESR